MSNNGQRLVVVTGASGGIGRSIATNFASKGYKVALGDIKPDITETASLISSQTGSEVKGFVADVSDFDSSEKFMKSAITELDSEQVDILVNNAGITRDSLFSKMTFDQWDSVIKVDLYSIFNCTRHVTEGMMKNGFGRIINISSVSRFGNKGQANYSSAKAGIVGITKTLAKELGKYGITSNAVSPGLIDTDILKTIPNSIMQDFINRIPSKRLGKPEEIAHLVAFLSSDEASYINGEVININGGFFF